MLQPPRPPAPTLLQKLLAKDIHTERSHLLQSFRFLVSNNFLLHADHAPVVFPAEPPPLPPEFDAPHTGERCTSFAAVPEVLSELHTLQELQTQVVQFLGMP